ncbi:MAG: hypothetical protein J6A69_02120 [Clostridia bacterium]|nr:hypothetical protein [Clostridia bacterium]
MSVLCVAKPADEFSLSERRQLASFPKLSVDTVKSGEFMSGFETYTAERFPMRDTFRGYKAWFSANVFRKLDNNGIFVADGHISKIDSDMNEEMMDYAAQRFLNINNKYLKNKNIKLFFAPVPDKNFILAPKNGYPSLDYKAFIDKMRQKTDYMQFIDITGLLDAEDYYTTDTHWRQEKITDIAEKLGAEMGVDVSAGYVENTLENPFYGVYTGQLAIPFKADTIKYLTNDTLNNCTVTYYDMGKPVTGEMYNMEKAMGKDPYEMFLSGTMPLITIENPDAKTDKELYLFRDSFGSSIAPLFAEGYKKITVIDIRYVQSDFLGALVEFKENSDALFLYSTTLLNNSMAMR